LSVPVRIYLDHNSTAPLHPAAATVWENFARAPTPENPSSIHWAGRLARRRLGEARAKLAELLGASDARELFFTASGSEANVMALQGALAFAPPARRRILVSAIEHPSVLGALEATCRRRPDLEVEVLHVTRGGTIDLDAAKARLGADVFLVSLMLANNETGVLQPVRDLALGARAVGALVHCDAAQAVGKMPVDVGDLGVDLLTAGGHKFGAGFGLGLLVNRGVRTEPLLPGAQEAGLRGGTENVAAAAAAAAALEATLAGAGETSARIGALRDRLEEGLAARVPNLVVHGAESPRLANTSQVSFLGAPAEAVLIGLDLEGIAVSSGSACASGSLEPSHVLRAMGISDAEAAAAVRFSLGPSNTGAEIERTIDTVAAVVANVRRHTGQ